MLKYSYKGLMKSQHLLNIYYVPRAITGILYKFSLLSLTPVMGRRGLLPSLFKGGNEVGRSQVIRSHMPQVLGPNPSLLTLVRVLTWLRSSTRRPRPGTANSEVLALSPLPTLAWCWHLYQAFQLTTLQLADRGGNRYQLPFDAELLSATGSLFISNRITRMVFS